MASDLVAKHAQKKAVIGAFAEKWTVIVVHALADGTRRYGELQRELGEITPKVLTETLRQLEYDGLVQRTVYPVVPPKVEYSLTPLGTTFVEAIDNLCQWAQEHGTDVEAARMRFEASHE
jgi:DNA-binding HxlR family transcriptional regulator